MKKLIYLPLIAIALVLLSSHDMYLKLNNYFLDTFTKSTVELFNGTFDKSENVIDRDRMTDVSILQNGERFHPSEDSWYEKDSITYLDFETQSEGTYVIGLSTRARTIEMDAEAFNDYLKHDGVLDLLEKREADGTLDTGAVELYSKHVKTIVQVGEALSDDWMTALNYPIEFIPLENPYDIHVGHKLPVQLFANQEPLASQLVYLGYKAPSTTHTHDGSTHTHDSDESHEHNDLQQFRTNKNGVIDLPIDREGVWYLRTIHLVELADSEHTHESNWATLTFAVGEGHSHEHSEEGHDEIPTYYFIVASILLIALLFFFFRSRNNEN
jgi:uncharacterized GH25 family protein